MAYFISEVKPTKGFHPISTSTVQLPRPSSLYRSCSLHLYYTLPPLVFVDTHELTERSSYYTYSHWGSRDLEKPVHALPDVSSEVLLNVPIPAQDEWDNDEGETISVEMPMHLRYGSPRSTRSREDADEKAKTQPYEEIHLDWPKAFFLCPSTSVSPLRHYLKRNLKIFFQHPSKQKHPSTHSPHTFLSPFHLANHGQESLSQFHLTRTIPKPSLHCCSPLGTPPTSPLLSL